MNKDNRLIVCIGDPHGCLVELDELLNKIGYNSEQIRLVMMGDLVDRGENSVGVVRRVRELGVECVKGNHEDKHIRFFEQQKKRSENKNYKGGKELCDFELNINKRLSKADHAWLKDLPIRIHLAHNYWAVHGGMIPAIAFDKQEDAKMMRARWVDENGNHKPLKITDSTEGAYIWSSKWKGPQSVIYGHFVQPGYKPRIDKFDGGECIGIDTGCCFGGKLTAWIWNPQTLEQKFVDVEAKKVYLKWEDKK